MVGLGQHGLYVHLPLKTDIHYGRHVRIDICFEGIRPTKSSETDT